MGRQNPQFAFCAKMHVKNVQPVGQITWVTFKITLILVQTLLFSVSAVRAVQQGNTKREFHTK